MANTETQNQFVHIAHRMRVIAALVKNDETKSALMDGAAEIDRLTKECATLRSDAQYFRENRDLMGAEVMKLNAEIEGLRAKLDEWYRIEAAATCRALSPVWR